jgi:hypothetical protein
MLMDGHKKLWIVWVSDIHTTCLTTTDDDHHHPTCCPSKPEKNGWWTSSPKSEAHLKPDLNLFVQSVPYWLELNPKNFHPSHWLRGPQVARWVDLIPLEVSKLVKYVAQKLVIFFKKKFCSEKQNTFPLYIYIYIYIYILPIRICKKCYILTGNCFRHDCGGCVWSGITDLW